VIRLVDDPDELRAFYATDPGPHIYALADLDEPCWSASQWYRDGDAVVGVVGLPEGDRVVYAVSSVAPEATLDLLIALDTEIPAATLLTGPLGLGAALEQRGGRSLAWNRTYRRYVLGDPSAIAAVDTSDVVALDIGDLDELEAFYATDPGAAFFLPSMLDDATFVGVRAEECLVAVAGTHVLAPRVRAAAIGAVLTAPEARGRGLAATVTAGVWRRLEGRATLVGLNCADRNVAAQRVYTRLGFDPILQYEEAEITA
jgi:ribosomal protein S18 acetylase RimI-like enzyme